MANAEGPMPEPLANARSGNRVSAAAAEPVVAGAIRVRPSGGSAATADREALAV